MNAASAMSEPTAPATSPRPTAMPSSAVLPVIADVRTPPSPRNAIASIAPEATERRRSGSAPPLGRTRPPLGSAAAYCAGESLDLPADSPPTAPWLVDAGSGFTLEPDGYTTVPAGCAGATIVPVAGAVVTGAVVVGCAGTTTVGCAGTTTVLEPTDAPPAFGSVALEPVPVMPVAGESGFFSFVPAANTVALIAPARIAESASSAGRFISKPPK